MVISPKLVLSDDSSAKKKVKKPKVLETPDLGIKYIELTKGSGPYPSPGDFVVISYT
jgi:FKBP-type peptidyl-prolyl cis-trans isomerase